MSTFPTSNPVRGSISPRDTPVSPPHGIPPVSSPPLVSFPSSSEPHRAVRTSPKSPGSYRFPPSLTAQDKAKFMRYFSKYSPVNGSLSGTCMSFDPSRVSGLNILPKVRKHARYLSSPSSQSSSSPKYGLSNFHFHKSLVC